MPSYCLTGSRIKERGGQKRNFKLVFILGTYGERYSALSIEIYHPKKATKMRATREHKARWAISKENPNASSLSAFIPLNEVL